ncbi:hypothetical protein JB92DRAFT_2942381, partial [Gautieria morchelliformis]
YRQEMPHPHASSIYPHGQHQGVFPLDMLYQDPMSLYHGLGSLENTSQLQMVNILTLFRILLKRILITICPTRSRPCTICYWKGYSRSILHLRPCILRRDHLGWLPRPMMMIITNSVCPRTPYWGFILPHNSTRRARSLRMRSRHSIHGDSLPCGNSCMTSHSRIRFCGHHIHPTAFQRLLRLTRGMDLAPLHQFRLPPIPVACRWMSRSRRCLPPPSRTLPFPATEQTVPTATSCPPCGAEESGYPKRGPGRSPYMLRR